MKKISTIAGFIILAASTSMAQQRVILESAGTNTAFGGASAFVDAYNAASDGDTLYLPGLQFSVPNPFDKSLTIIGAGYHPDRVDLFGRTQGSTIMNLGLPNVNIRGDNYVGGLVGNSDRGSISQCFSSGAVSGDDNPHFPALRSDPFGSFRGLPQKAISLQQPPQ